MGIRNATDAILDENALVDVMGSSTFEPFASGPGPGRAASEAPLTGSRPRISARCQRDR